MKNGSSQLITIFAISWLWFLIASANIFPTLLLPPPQAILGAFWRLFSQNIIVIDIAMTLSRVIIGLIIGILAGLLIGFSANLFADNRNFIFWIDFLRSIPAPGLYPVFILFFGLGDISQIALVVLYTTLIIAINTIYGIKNINHTRLLFAQSLHLGRLKTFLQIILPDSLPHISAGIRHAISYALIIVVVAEMFFGSNNGLGSKISEYHLLYETDKMYATIIITGILGFTLNKLYLILENKKIHWMGK